MNEENIQNALRCYAYYKEYKQEVKDCATGYSEYAMKPLDTKRRVRNMRSYMAEAKKSAVLEATWRCFFEAALKKLTEEELREYFNRGD